MAADEKEAPNFAQFVKMLGFELADWQLRLAEKVIAGEEIVLSWESNGARTVQALIDKWKELA